MTDVKQEHDSLAVLAGAAETLARSVEADAPQLAEEAHGVLGRLRERRFEVGVVGEFNRGKSTLLNLLVDRFVLPAGVLPVTSIVTELTYGDEEAKIVFEDGTDEVIDLTEIERYVSEEANPGNARRVHTARIALPAPMLRHGAVLVDTPGVGSIFRHNSELARETILHADGAVMVMSADTPITDAERSLIKLLSRRSQRTFFVLNRIDFLEADELERVRWFVENVLTEAFGQPQQLYCLSARTRAGFEPFAQAFEEFLTNGLDEARLSLARRDLAALADRIENECALEESALTLTAAELDEKLAEFRRAAESQNESFADDCVLFEHASQRMLAELEERIAGADQVSDAAFSRIRQAAEEAPAAEIDATLDKAIEDEVKAVIEPMRRQEEFEIERTWRRAAERFERATQRRVDRLGETAGDLFHVDLRPVELAQPANQRGRFFYSSPVHVEPTGGAFGRFLRQLSGRNGRRRVIETGDQRLTEEVRRHLERLRDDLVARTADANRSLAEGMGEQVRHIGDAITQAVERAQAAKASAIDDQRAQRDRAQRLRAAATAARTAAGEA